MSCTTPTANRPRRTLTLALALIAGGEPRMHLDRKPLAIREKLRRCWQIPGASKGKQEQVKEEQV